MAQGRRASKVFLLAGLTGAFAAATGLALPRAQACGCFTPPDPSVPIVQAGERIAFAMKDGTVTAHIQIQYQGDAKDFGWLLPLPSIPDMQLGTDELFTQLTTQTQPKYRLVRNYQGNCGFNNFGRGGAGPVGVSAPTAGGMSVDNGNSPLVFQASIGPYDYAVLKADSKDPMLKWLADNHYFVPAGTDETVGAYIRPGAYFLALKLQSGQSSGDLQPVVVKYASDLPMIPIVLTSVAAQPHMGIQVWMLGESRAIPRNYFHTVLNDVLIDWWSSGSNYNDVVINAVGEAKGKHSYITEYAGSSKILKQVLNAPGRFGDLTALAAQPDIFTFVQYMWQHGFPQTSPVFAILGRAVPYPPGLAKMGISEQAFYQNLQNFTSSQFRAQAADAFAGWPGITYMPDMLVMDLTERVVKPTLAAGAMFDDNSYLTRLYTTLSPEDMTLDPVFSFNPDLPEVNNVHQATLTYYCGFGAPANDQNTTPARLVTEQGWSRDFPSGTGPQNPPLPGGLTYSRQIQVLRESGPPEVVTDNPPPAGCACAMNTSDGARGAGALLALAGVVVLLRRKRRR